MKYPRMLFMRTYDCGRPVMTAVNTVENSKQEADLVQELMGCRLVQTEFFVVEAQELKITVSPQIILVKSDV